MSNAPAPQPPPRPPLRRRPLGAWLRITRPLMTVALTLFAIGLAYAWSQGDATWHVVTRLAIATAAMSMAAAIFNDIRDREHDATAHLWRPIPAGLIQPAIALRVAAGLGLIAVVLAASLGWRDFLILGALVATASLYSLEFRGSMLGWLAFVLTGALLPLWVAEAVNDVRDALWWSIPVGGFAGLATYLVYKLPDFERDDADGERNILHWMTIDYAIPLAWAAVGGAIALAVGSANIENLRAEWIVPAAATAIAVALVVIGILTYRVTERRLVWQRWLLVPCMLAIVVGWMGSIAP